MAACNTHQFLGCCSAEKRAAQLKQAYNNDPDGTLGSSLITAIQMPVASGNPFTIPHPSTVSILPLQSQGIASALITHTSSSSMTTHSGDQGY